MTLDNRLIELLVCPACKGPLVAVRADGALRALACPADHLAFPVRDGMPVMLESQAQPYDGSAGPVTSV
jgi:uncharacterized protein